MFPVLWLPRLLPALLVCLAVAISLVTPSAASGQTLREFLAGQPAQPTAPREPPPSTYDALLDFNERMERARDDGWLIQLEDKQVSAMMANRQTKLMQSFARLTSRGWSEIVHVFWTAELGYVQCEQMEAEIHTCQQKGCPGGNDEPLYRADLTKLACWPLAPLAAPTPQG